MNWVLFWLFLHILAAIIGFGPVFIFPLLGSFAPKYPRQLGVITHLSHKLETIYVQRVGGTLLISGIGLIWAADINFFQTFYLIAAVVLYFFAFAVAGSVLVPNTQKMVAIVDANPDGFGPDNPPPESLLTLAMRNRSFGMMLTVVFLAIVFLMIVQPGGIVYRT